MRTKAFRGVKRAGYALLTMLITLSVVLPALLPQRVGAQAVGEIPPYGYYIRNFSNGDIDHVNLEGGRSAVLKGDKQNGVSWAPRTVSNSGKRLVVDKILSTGYESYVLDRDSGNLTKIEIPEIAEWDRWHAAVWSKDEKKILYQYFRKDEQAAGNWRAKWLTVGTNELSEEMPNFGPGSEFVSVGDYLYYLKWWWNGQDYSRSRICWTPEIGYYEQCGPEIGPLEGDNMTANVNAISKDGVWFVQHVEDHSEPILRFRKTNGGEPKELRLKDYAPVVGERFIYKPGHFTPDGSYVFEGATKNNGHSYFVVNPERTEISRVGVSFRDRVEEWSFSPTDRPFPVPSGYFTSIAPQRVVDTRTGSGSIYAGKTLKSGESLKVKLTGVAGVPATGVSSVVANVTAVNATNTTYLTVHSASEARPTVSNLNVQATQIVNNEVTTAVDSTGYATIYNHLGSIDVVVDVVGYYSKAGQGYLSVEPKRILDTRQTSQRIPAGGSLVVDVAGVNGLPANAQTVAGQITITNNPSNGWVAVYPEGSEWSGTSTVNHYAWQNITRGFTSSLGSGKMVIKNSNHGPVDVVIDVSGVYLNNRSYYVYQPITPVRLLDNRNRGYTSYPEALTCSPSPNGYDAMVACNINLTMTSNTVPTYLSVSDKSDVPLTTTFLTSSPWGIVANSAKVGVSNSGGFSIRNFQGQAHFIVDQFGYFY